MRVHTLVLAVALSILALSPTIVVSARPLSTSPDHVSFLVDIYGDARPETISYSSDLEFYGYGGFGSNASILGAELQSGDGIQFAISEERPDAFTILAKKNDGTLVPLNITTAMYRTGTVIQISPTQLRAEWEVEVDGLHFKLVRLTERQINPNTATGFSVKERIVVVDLVGQPFTVLKFTEHLHGDDAFRTADLDCDGETDTLLVSNAYSSQGYPIFAKIYQHPETRTTNIQLTNSFAVVDTMVSGVTGIIIPASGHQTVLEATYISSTAKEQVTAENQIDRDAAAILNLQEHPPLWSVRSYNTDDRSGIFINGLMVVGTRWGTFPDSGWVDVCKHWKKDAANYVSFAAWDYGGSGSSSWAFDVRRNGQSIHAEDGGSGAGLGLSYSGTIEVSPEGNVTEITHTPPTVPIGGVWELAVDSDNGFAFALVGNHPVAGGADNYTAPVDISSFLGQQVNHIYINSWSIGEGTHTVEATLTRDGTLVWESNLSMPEHERGRSHFLDLIVDKDGNVFPALDLPVDYSERATGSESLHVAEFVGRVTSVFDHQRPVYGQFDGYIYPFIGGRIPNPGGALSCGDGPRPLYVLGCYDSHDAYDFGKLPGNNQSADMYAVYPAADGVIVQAETGWKWDALGCRITIDHGNGWKTKYSHLDGEGRDAQNNPICPGLLKSSGPVSRFDAIAKIGCTGSGCGYIPVNAHLHFTVLHRIGNVDVVVDPSGWANPSADPWENQHPSYPMWRFGTPPVTRALDPTMGGSLALEQTPITVTVPSAFYSSPLTFTLSNVPVGGELQVVLRNAGSSFAILAADADEAPIQQLARDLIIELRWNDTMEGIKLDTLTVYRWTPATGTWTAVPATTDVANRRVYLETTILGTYALMGEPHDKLFLPLVRRD